MKGPLCYIGGKWRMAARLLPLLPPHTTYCEPFCGGAQLFFRKPRSRVEILNDLDLEIVNFLRVCQHHHQELIRLLRFVVASRQLYRWHLKQDPTLLTDVQRAARFFYLQKNAFGGLVVGQTYHYAIVKPPNYNPERIADDLEQAAARLARVQLENRPYEEVLTAFDRSSTLFFVDPPYVGKHFYRHNFADGDFEALAQRLAALSGKFLLTLNDCALVRRVFDRFVVRRCAHVYTAGRNGQRVSELVIANYALPTELKRPSCA